MSRDIMASFAETKAGKAQVDIDLSVNVLTMGFWPSYTTMEVNLPVKLAEYQVRALIGGWVGGLLGR